MGRYQEFEILDNRTSHYHISRISDFFDIKMISVMTDEGSHAFVYGIADASLVGNEFTIITKDKSDLTYFFKNALDKGYFKDNEICFRYDMSNHINYEVNPNDIDSIVNYLTKNGAIRLV